MKIYFFAQSTTDAKLILRYEKIKAALKSAGVLYVTNLDEETTTKFSPQDLDRVNETGEILLDKMDGIIIEGTTPSSEIGYLLAYAMARRKPVLYLIEQRLSQKELPYYLSNKDTIRFLYFKKYTRDNLESIIIKYLRMVDTSGTIKEAANIKFTLRITPQIERYLRWRSARAKKSKADFLRDYIVEEIMKKDEKYNKYLGEE